MTAQDSLREPLTAARGAGPIEAARIGWRRARSFNLLNRGAHSWTGALIAAWLWPFETMIVALNWGRLRRLDGASMTLTDGTSPRMSRPVVLTAVALLLAQLAVVVAVALPLTVALLGPLSASWAAVGALVIVTAPLLLELGVRLTRLARSPEVRSLSARQRELAAGSGAPVFVMSAFVRARAGEGSRLLRALQEEWQRTGAVVLFNPANEAVAAYYQRHGAVADSPSRAVMRFDYRAGVAT
ncbi:hypothetical protein [Nakamurella endophytica]|uniref:Uncharacterized protein n=1 Tax=Nakamurella endophytica TaxID=1748367 RepID=A0A917T3G7_9ACTN|nr:hypothetical protein [Nakamurella endophytica]GGM09562.1 hypothetical protein GCM10011594_31810 [Nakamurella endophytica]